MSRRTERATANGEPDDAGEAGQRPTSAGDEPTADFDGSRRDALKTAGAGVGALTLGPSIGAGSVDAESAEKVDASTARAATPPRLSVDGNRIVTAEGEAVTLRGLDVVDPKRANTETAGHGRTAEGTIELLTDAEEGWHPDVIRVPVQPIDIGDHESGRAPEPVAFTADQLDAYLAEHLDPVLERCAEAGVYAIVDFHRHWPEVQWGDAEEGTVNEELQEETLLFWEIVAPRYADDDHVVYEVYNEPAEPGMWGSIAEEWVQSVWMLYLEFAQPIVDEIRAHTDTLALVGSPGWTQSPEGALVEPVEGENVAYTYHVYPGHESSRRRDWEDSSINGLGVEGVYEEYPLFVTEFGWRDSGDDLYGGTTAEFGEPFLEWLESHDSIHWTAWCADVWWEPALFQSGFEGACDDPPCEWELLGRDAGSKADAGEYVRRALEVGGVPEDYWEDDGSNGTDDDDGRNGDDDDGGDGENGDDGDGDDDDGTGTGDGDGGDNGVDDGNGEGDDGTGGIGGDGDDGPDGDTGSDGSGDEADDSVPGFGIAATIAGIAGGAAVAVHRRIGDDSSE